MKILQVIPNMGSGGAEHFTVELSNELVKQGCECDIVTLYDIPTKNALIDAISSKVPLYSLHKQKGLDLRCFFRLYRFIKQGAYDVVHAHVGAIPYILLSCILLKKKRFVATIHSEARRESGRSFMRWSRFLLFKFNLCTPVTISEESKSSFDNYYKMNAAMVYNGVSNYSGMGVKSLKDNPKQLLFVHPASCQIVKNQELLFKAFSKLLNNGYNVKLLWMGNSTSFPLLYDSLKSYLGSNIQYIGIVPNVRDYLIQADAMCLSSKMEGMPLTIIEAFSVGCPALCTPVGGILNMIKNDYNGMLSEDMSEEKYYEMLSNYCNKTQPEREEMKKNALSSFQKYSITDTTHRYISIYGS